MLTDLNWLSPGSPYPPKAEADRIKRYQLNDRLFQSDHANAWKSDFTQIAERFRKKEFDVTAVLNYQQLLSKKTADFVCGEPPTFQSRGDTDKLMQLLNRENFSGKLYESFIDVSRYGDAVPKIVGQGLTLVSPMYWFPIVAPTDIKTVVQHVIAYPVTPDSNGDMTQLYAEIHTPGVVEQRMYEYDPKTNTIGKPVQAPKSTATGLTDFAIQVLSNLTCSSSIYGIDDYTIINSLVQTAMWRLHCADRILDKHSDPSLSGPSSALTYDERFGRYYLDLGNYFKRDNKDDPDLKYITWDGNLDANFKELDFLIKQLYILTEMGQAFMEGGGEGNSADSGTALKLRMVSPRIKAQRLTGINTPAVKNVIALLGQVNGLPVDVNTLDIHWNDGLPVDEKEQTDTLVSATGNKPVMSQFSALKQRGLSDEQAEAELTRMREEAAANTPPVLSVVDRNASGPGDEFNGGKNE